MDEVNARTKPAPVVPPVLLPRRARTAAIAITVAMIAMIQKMVAGYYNIRVADLRGPKQHRHVAMPRHIAMYLAREHIAGSYQLLGRSFGGRNHSTVITACRKIARKRAADPYLDRVLVTLEQQILASSTSTTPAGE
ncbi:hypothetical protein HY477_02320 [Candidatus Uhrbacteria bacterium]|nr:hypothetical protein [Candidatus Uhrbacteria bacterium]